MIRNKFEVEEEEETPLPIENENVGSTNDDILTKKTPENNVVVAAKVQNKVVSKKKPKLDNFTTNSVAVVSKSIKTEPAESSLSLTTQLNNSLNIQSLLRQNRIQNGWTTNEQSIPNGTQQQQQQSLLLSKIEPIVSGIHQEVPLSLDLSSLIPNLNSNSGETTLATTNCDTTTKMSPGPRAGLGCRAKLNKVCYSVPKEPEPSPPPSADNSELASNDNDQHYGTFFGIDPSFASTSSTTEVAALSPEAAVPLLVGKKPLPLGIPPLTSSLEENKARKSRERSREYYLKVGKQRRGQWLTNATPEQREQRRLKNLEANRQQRANETEEQRERRLEQMRQYARTVAKQKRQTMTPEEWEKKRANQREYYYKSKNKKLMMEKNNELESQTSTSSINLVMMDNCESSNSTLNQHLNHSSSTSTINNDNNNNGIVQIETTISKREKKKPGKKRFELSMDDSHLSHFDIDSGGGGGGEESNSHIATLQSLKPGPSNKVTSTHRVPEQW